MASMFPQLGATADSLSKASSLVLRIGTDAHLYDDPDDASIGPLLDSRFDSDKSEALKRLLALIAQGADVSHFFPQVVKNVASSSLEVKKLVYLYLLHYAEKRPNEALLSINYFQKDLSDTNPLVRAWALRTMAGIRLHVVAPLVLVAVGKSARDPSAYVRKCAANALPKLSDLRHEENASALEELVGVLMSDHSPMVVGAAAAAFNSVCPNNLLLIGKNFRRLCETLLDVEEWGQIVLIGILLRYVVAKHGLVRESLMFVSSCTVSSESEKDSCSDSLECDDNHVSVASDAKLNALMFKCYMEGQEEFLSQPGLSIGDADQSEKVVSISCKNEDVKLLLQCTSPLLWSQNSAVVLAAAGVRWIMAPRDDVQRIVKPLLFLLRSSHSSKYVILCNIQAFAKVLPEIFAPYFEDFFICNSDSYHVRALKLDILSTIASDSSAPIIFEEFQDYIVDPDRQFVADTIAAIGLCAQRLPSMANTCLEGLLALTVQESSICNGDHMNHEAAIVVQAIMSIKAIIKLDPATHEKVIIRLVRLLDAIKEPIARALIVWIVGEYNFVGEIIPKVIPTVVSYLAWSFISEEVETKLQILNTVAKIAVSGHKGEQQMVRKNLSYVLELAKCDLNYDVRDRARTIEQLVDCYSSLDNDDGNIGSTPNNGIIREFVEQILSGKLQTTYPSVNNSRFYLPGSLSQIVLHTAPGYSPLPKPCSLLDSHHHLCSEMSNETRELDMRMGKTALSSSGTSMEENDSDYDSEHSYLSSNASEGFASKSDGFNDDNQSTLSGHSDPPNENEVPLVHISDVGVNDNPSALGNTSLSFSTDLTELMSKSALESWLDEQPSSSAAQNSFNLTSARISINNLHYIAKPKMRALLDPVNGNGLKLEYAFASEVSSLSPSLVCIEVHFENCSAAPLNGISVKGEDSNASIDSACQISENSERVLTASDVPTLVPMDEISSLEPGEAVKRVLQVCFQHHLLPLKLAVLCNSKKHSIKLWPDIGYFMRPLTMNMEAFLHKESQLPGMFECIKRCTFRDHIEDMEHEEGQHPAHCDDKFLVVARCLATKVLSNTNVHLVNVDMPVSSDADNVSGLCLRFSGEILSSLKPCLITTTADGKFSLPLEISVKVNCEDPIFGLNLLNRVVGFLQ